MQVQGILTTALFLTGLAQACFGQDAWARSAPLAEVTIQACVHNRLAARRGSENCWAQLTWVESEKSEPEDWGRVCVTRPQWQRMLHAQGPRCGVWKGKWKIYAPPLNDPSTANQAKPRKEMLRSFQVIDFPEGEGSLLERSIWRIDRAREAADAWIAPYDRTGVLRELLTATKPEGGSLQLLSLLGFVHLLLAAGIHLYALAGCVHWALRTVAIRCEGLPLGWAKRLATVITIAVWLSAWVLEGGRPGMLRPWIVVCLRSGARRLGLRWRRLAPLAIALALDGGVALWRGEFGGPHGHGRWVYALACGGGLIARSAPWFAIGSWILAAWLEALHTGNVSLGTPILSALTVPLYAGILYPLLLLAWTLKMSGLTVLAASLAGLCGGISQTSVEWLAAAAMRPGSLWSVSRFALTGGLALGAFSLGLRRRTRVAALVVITALRLGLAEVQAVQSTNAISADQVWQLDIGQGDAALIRGRTSSGKPSFGLIDVGPERALSDRAWMELLSRFGVHRVDWIALTHLDEDHAGGLKRLALLARIGCVATAREQLETTRGRAFSADLARIGVKVTSWEGGCVPYPVLGPPESKQSKSRRKPKTKGNAAKGNAMMSAIYIPLQGGGFYLSAGDADAQDEPRIGRWAAALARDLSGGDFNRPSLVETPRILKVSHHGSRTSSTPAFLETVAPTEAWISNGAGNRYGHPTASVLERLRHFKIPVRRTDEEGALTF